MEWLSVARASGPRYIALFLALGTIVIWLRHTRLALWGKLPLQFEDTQDDVVVLPIYPR